MGMRKKICVIDGQGGGIGSAIIKKLKVAFGESVEILALGTNAIATAQMLKAQANRGAPMPFLALDNHSSLQTLQPYRPPSGVMLEFCQTPSQ